MASRTEGEHPGCVRVVIRPKPAKTGQQTVVQIDDAAPGKFPTGFWRQNAHVACQNDVVRLVLIDNLNHRLVVTGTVFATDVLKWHTEFLGQRFACLSISDDDRRIGTDNATSNCLQDGTRRVLKAGRADCYIRTKRTFIRAPNPDLQSLLGSDLAHRQLDGRKLTRVDMNAAHHREQRSFIVVVHLNFRDVRTTRCDVVNNRVGQAHIVWPYSSDHDFHGYKVS